MYAGSLSWGKGIVLFHNSPGPTNVHFNLYLHKEFLYPRRTGNSGSGLQISSFFGDRIPADDFPVRRSGPAECMTAKQGKNAKAGGNGLWRKNLSTGIWNAGGLIWISGKTPSGELPTTNITPNPSLNRPWNPEPMSSVRHKSRPIRHPAAERTGTMPTAIAGPVAGRMRTVRVIIPPALAASTTPHPAGRHVPAGIRENPCDPANGILNN